MIDVFVDRCFRHNFDPSNADDAFLVRRIAFLNEVLLDAGLVPSIYSLRGGVGASRGRLWEIVARLSLEGADKSPCGCGAGAGDAVVGGSSARAMTKKEGRG